MIYLLIDLFNPLNIQAFKAKEQIIKHLNSSRPTINKAIKDKTIVNNKYIIVYTDIVLNNCKGNF